MSKTSVPAEVTYRGPAQAGIKIIIYKEIKPGDLRKFRAESNDATTGGGARDLRFRPHERFDPIFERMFPDTVTERRKSVRVGTVHWHDGKHQQRREAKYWPPTEARPGEGRWAKVHLFPPFQAEMPDDQGRLVILLIQNSKDEVWLRIETEMELRSPDWDQRVVNAIFECIDSQPREDRSAQGYIDFTRGKRFCHAG